MNKRLLILLALFVALPVIIGTVILLSGGDNENPGSEDPSSQTNTGGSASVLKINGLENHRDDIDAVSALNIEKVLHRYLGDDSKPYTGSIREGSYAKQPANNLYIVRFLVDIESLQQTYAVLFSGPSNLVKYSPISIECPEQAEVRYKSTACKIGM